MVQPCISKAWTTFFHSENVCTHMLQENAIRSFGVLFCLILSMTLTAIFACLLFSIIYFLSVDVTIHAFSKLQSVFVEHNPFLHICISIGLTTLLDGWFSCGLLLFATQSSLGTLTHWDSSWVYMLTASLGSQQQHLPSSGAEGDPSGEHCLPVPTKKGQQFLQRPLLSHWWIRGKNPKSSHSLVARQR